MGHADGAKWEAEHGWPQQAAPIQNEYPAVWDLVLSDLTRIKFPYTHQQVTIKLLAEDIRKRDAAGAKKYGTRLQPCNGRNAKQDAYEEALDAIVYMRQDIEELRMKSQLIITPENKEKEEYSLQTYFLQIEVALRLRYALKQEENINNVTTINASNDRSPEESSTDQPDTNLS